MTEKNGAAIVIGSNGGVGGSVFKRLKNSEAKRENAKKWHMHDK